MATKIKTVLLYDLRRIRPTTLEAIANAEDGECVPVERAELDSFLPLTILGGEAERMHEERVGTRPPKKKAARKK